MTWLYIYIYLFFFRFFSHIGYYRVLNRIPHAAPQPFKKRKQETIVRESIISICLSYISLNAHTCTCILHHDVKCISSCSLCFKKFEKLFFFFFLIIYLRLCWVLVSVRGLSPVAASGGHSSSRCAGLPLSWPPPLQSTGSRRAGSAAVAHGPSRSAACGILPDQGSNPCPPHWQADSQPLRHQGSPEKLLKN